MKKKTRQITVITTTIMRKANYIKSFFLRNDGQVQVELTTNLREAYEFDRDHAENIVEKIFNPYERTYQVEDTLVEWQITKSKLIPGELK